MKLKLLLAFLAISKSLSLVRLRTISNRVVSHSSSLPLNRQCQTHLSSHTVGRQENKTETKWIRHRANGVTKKHPFRRKKQAPHNTFSKTADRRDGANNQSDKTAAFNQWLQGLIHSNRVNGKMMVVQRAENALMQRIETGCTDFNTISFNVVLNGWAQQRNPVAAKKADDLLHKLLKLQEQKEYHQRLQADTYSYSAVLNAYAKSGGGKKAALRAEELLMQLKNSYLSSTPSISGGEPPCDGAAVANDGGTAKIEFCYNTVMNAWAASGDPSAGQRAERWLRHMKSPSRISYNCCIKAWARSRSPQKAQRLLQQMQQLSLSNPDLKPDKISISICIDAWSKSTHNITQAVHNAEALLKQMEKMFEDALGSTSTSPFSARGHKGRHASRSTDNDGKHSHADFIRPDVIAYTSVLSAYAKSGLPEAPQKALELIQRMEHYAGQKPNANFFNTFIALLANTKPAVSSSTTTTPSQALLDSKTPGDCFHNSSATPSLVAETILQNLKDQYQRTSDPSIRPDKITYTAVISTYANEKGSMAAAERAIQLLDELEHLFNTTGEYSYLPNAVTFGTVLNVWAKTAASLRPTADSESTDSGSIMWKKADSLLDRLERLYHRTGSEDLKPTTIFFCHIFRILSEGRHKSAANRAMDLLKKMKDLNKKDGFGDNIQPDATTYAYVVNTFTKSGLENAAELATRILQEVEDGYKAGMGNLKPTTLLYSAVLQAYAKNASREGAVLAEELLQRTKMLYMQGKLYAKPTTLYYNAVIDAYARSNGGRAAALRAEELLDEMEARGSAGDLELCLKTRSFNAAILAWKNSNASDAAERAEALLRRMRKRYKSGDQGSRPDRVTMNSIIGVWAKSSDPRGAQRAGEFLDFMEKMALSGDFRLKPDIYSFNSVIHAYSRSSSEGAAKKAQELYERMMALYEAGDIELRPDIITLTSLRNAWLRSNETEAHVYIQEISSQIAANRKSRSEDIDAA